jgi:nucleotide-binding universal stress UspA family protein
MDVTTPDIKRILCPIDLSDMSAHVVDQAVAVARWYKARVLGLHVYTPIVAPLPGMPTTFDNPEGPLVQQLRANTQSAFQRAINAGIEVDVTVDTGRPAAEILARAQSFSADMIVIGTHGSGGFEHLCWVRSPKR